MIILGIDPGFAKTGYGVVENKERKLLHCAHGVIVSSRTMAHSKRLLHLQNSLQEIIQTYKPDRIAVEDLFIHKNMKTAIKVGEARGVILVTGVRNNVRVCEFTPLQIKQALTGYGRASKHQMQKMVQFFLQLPALPKPDDAADALAAAICCSNIYGE